MDCLVHLSAQGLVKMLVFLIAFCIWALVHSVTASSRFKGRVRQVIGQRAFDGWYRLFYNIASAATLFPLLIIGRWIIPDEVIWSVPSPLSLFFYAAQLLAMLGLLLSLWQTDLLRFAGLSQVQRYLAGEDHVLPPPKMVTRGTYSLVRHPLYFFSLLIIWLVPTMTMQLLIFNLAATVYFVVGSIHEERRLLEVFGEEYIAYRSKVPGIIPVKLK
jgi:protein-S-isoprenylcysteine O-methyltransferase Ste14